MTVILSTMHYQLYSFFCGGVSGRLLLTILFDINSHHCANSDIDYHFRA